MRLPRGGGAAPLVLFLHGGFWRAEFDRAHTGCLAAALAEAGYAVCTPEFRRVGQTGGWPETFDDVAAAVDALPYLVAEAAGPGRVAAGEVVLAGHSAGGHLALWAAGRHRLPAGSGWRVPQGTVSGGAGGAGLEGETAVGGAAEVGRAASPGGAGAAAVGRAAGAGGAGAAAVGGDLAVGGAGTVSRAGAVGEAATAAVRADLAVGGVGVRGVVALAPVSDLAACYALGLGAGAASALMGGGPERYPERYALADPARLLPLGRPVRIVHGCDDDRVPCAMSRDYVARAVARGDDVVLDELPGCGHFEVIDPESAAWPSVLAAFRAVAPRSAH